MFVYKSYITFIFLSFITACATCDKINAPNPNVLPQKEYSKQELLNNNDLFTEVRFECASSYRQALEETCSNVRKILIDIYKQQARDMEKQDLEKNKK